MPTKNLNFTTFIDHDNPFQLGMSYGLEHFYVEDIVRIGVAVEEPIVSELFFFRPTIFCFVDAVEVLLGLNLKVLAPVPY